MEQCKRVRSVFYSFYTASKKEITLFRQENQKVNLGTLYLYYINCFTMKNNAKYFSQRTTGNTFELRRPSKFNRSGHTRFSPSAIRKRGACDP